MSKSSGNTERETFGDTGEGKTPPETRTVSAAPTSKTGTTASGGSASIRKLDSDTGSASARTVIAERSTQTTTVKVLAVTPIPSPTPENPGRTYYTLEAANSVPRNERDHATLELQHISLDDELIHVGDSIGIHISSDPPPEEMLVSGDSVLRPFDVVGLPGNAPENPDDAIWFFTVTFYDPRTEEWADGYMESGQLTIGTQEEDAITLGGYVAIRWNGEF